MLFAQETAQRLRCLLIDQLLAEAFCLYLSLSLLLSLRCSAKRNRALRPMWLLDLADRAAAHMALSPTLLLFFLPLRISFSFSLSFPW